MFLQLYDLHFIHLKDFATNTYIRHHSCMCRPYLGDLKVLNHRSKDFYFFHIYFWMVFAGVSTGKLQIRMLWLSSFSIRQFDWLGFLSIICEFSTKIGTVRDLSECADASKVPTRCRSDACGSYSWLILHCKPELKETTGWTTVGQAKDIASSPNPLVKALCWGRHWVWGPTRRRAIIEWSIAINRVWINN